MTALSDYLASCADTKILAIGQIRFGRHTFECVRYTQRDSQERIYIIGDRPPVLKRKRKMAIRFADDTRDWYVAAYIPSLTPLADWQKSYHPFGLNFLLCVWDAKEPIDAHNYWRGEPKPYLRIPAAFETTP